MLKKYFKNQQDIVIAVAVISLYLFTRLYNLTLLPIFTDEAIYIYWAKFISVNYSHWFLSLTDGKPPLLIWMITVLLWILPKNLYLIAGRLPSVTAGLIGLIGMYVVSYKLFNSKKMSLIASILYIISPFMLFHDRIALFDSLLSSVLLWSVYFALKTQETRKISHSIWWGLSIGLAFLSKPTALIFVFLTPIIYILLTKKQDLVKNYQKSTLLILIAVFISELINNLQRVSSVYFLMDAKNQQFRVPLNELLVSPFLHTIGNLNGFYSWIINYYTMPFLILGIVAFIFLLTKNLRHGIVLFILWFAPIFALATIGREIFPRYILFTTPYFLIACAYLLERILTNSKYKILYGIITIGILIPQLNFSYLLLTNPPQAPLPHIDYNQYIGEHPSGYGLDEIFAYIDNELKTNKVTIATQGTFGLYHYAFQLHYWDNPNIMIVPRWPLSVIDQDIIDAQKNSKVFIVLKEHEQIPENLPLELVLKAEKPSGKFPILLTKLKSE